MSHSINKLKVARINDPVLNYDESPFYGVLMSGDRVSWKPILSTSFSNSSAVFTAPPPDPKTSVCRSIKIRQPITIDFVGNAPNGQRLLQSGYDAPRAYPISTNMNTMQLDLNNTSFSINMSDTIQALLRYHNRDSLKDGEMSMTPSTMDQTQQYSDLQGSIQNPLGSVVDSAIGGLDGRGAFPFDSITNNVSTGIGNDTTASISFTATEDLFLSPLVFGCDTGQDPGFIGLQTMQLTINWLPDLSRIWCHDNSGGTTLTQVNVTLGQPTLLMQYKTPNLLQNVPRRWVYPYYEVQRYPTDSNSAFAAGEERIVSSSNIQLNSIPRIMYIFARKRNSDLTFTDTDTFLSIERISINWANQSGLLSNASKQDLYEMSKKNGCNLNWRQWSGESSPFNSGSTEQNINGVGSVLGIEFATDIALLPDQAPGMNGTYQLQLDVTMTNRSSSSITPTLYVTIINEGVFTIENNSAYSQIGVVSKEDVLTAGHMQGIDYCSLKYMAGAAWYDKFAKKLKTAVKMVAKHGPKYLKSAVKTYKEVAPIIKEIAMLAGMGTDEAQQLYKAHKRDFDKYGAVLVYKYTGGGSASGTAGEGDFY